MPDPVASFELPGLSVTLDKLVYRPADLERSGGLKHTFIYFLSIRNHSQSTVTFLGRKWIIDHAEGGRQIVEGDKIVGETPTLAPGGVFSYNSFHLTDGRGTASGSFHGIDKNGRKIHVRIPPFSLEPPEGAPAPE